MGQLPEYVIYGNGHARHIRHSSGAGTLCNMFAGSLRTRLELVRPGDERILLPLCRACARTPRGRVMVKEGAK